jgi:hypothetical protein
MNANEPAFPVAEINTNNGVFTVIGSHPGLTKREYFAAMEQLEPLDDISKSFTEALVGEPIPNHTEPMKYWLWESKLRARLKLLRADALIAELERIEKK